MHTKHPQLKDLPDHFPDADIPMLLNGRGAHPPKRTLEYVETLLTETLRELAQERAERERLQTRLERHPERD